MSQSTRRCVFCSGAGPLTREHAVAQWIEEILGDMEDENASPPQWGAHYTAGGLVQRDRQHRVGGASVVVRAVCTDCNSGWMASLEARVKPFMEPLIRGERVTMDVTQQIALATWASKTFVTLEFQEPGTVVTRPEDREVIRWQDRPPHHHVVRLAYRPEYREALLLHWLVARSEDAPDDRPNAFGALMGIGFLLVQVWGGHGADLGQPLTRYGTAFDQAVMIWPPVPTGVSWPPQVAVPDDQFDAFAREVLPWGTDSPDLAAWRSTRLTDPGT